MAVVSPANDTDWPCQYAASSLAVSNVAEAERLVAEGQASGAVLKMTSTYAQPMRVQVRAHAAGSFSRMRHCRCMRFTHANLHPWLSRCRARQVRELLSKFWLVYWRTPSYTLARVFLTLCVAFIYGSMYFGAGRLPSPYATMGSVQNVLGVMFSSTNFLGMTNLMAVMPLVGACWWRGDCISAWRRLTDSGTACAPGWQLPCMLLLLLPWVSPHLLPLPPPRAPPARHGARRVLPRARRAAVRRVCLRHSHRARRHAVPDCAGAPSAAAPSEARRAAPHAGAATMTPP